jgi:hypothetical protein
MRGSALGGIGKAYAGVSEGVHRTVPPGGPAASGVRPKKLSPNGRTPGGADSAGGSGTKGLRLSNEGSAGTVSETGRDGGGVPPRDRDEPLFFATKSFLLAFIVVSWFGYIITQLGGRSQLTCCCVEVIAGNRSNRSSERLRAPPAQLRRARCGIATTGDVQTARGTRVSVCCAACHSRASEPGSREGTAKWSVRQTYRIAQSSVAARAHHRDRARGRRRAQRRRSPDGHKRDCGTTAVGSRFASRVIANFEDAMSVV